MSNDEISQKNLLNVIDFELKKFDDEVTKAGWNFWILLASIASLGWLLLEELEVARQEWKFSLFIFLIVALMLEALGNFRSILSPTNQYPVVNRFSIASTQFGSLRTWFMFVIVRNSILIGVTIFTKNLYIYYWLILIFYGIYTLMAMFVLGSSFSDTPIKSKRNTGFNYSGLIIVLLCIFFISGMLYDIFSGKLAIEIVEYKIGFALVAILFLASNILTITQNSYLKDKLINIRRNFLLGNIDLDEAKRQIEILLLGMQVSDFVKNEIQDLMNIFQEQNHVIAQEHKKYDETISKINSLDFNQIQQDELIKILTQIVNLMDSARKDTTDLITLNQKIENQIKKIVKKISRLGPDATLEKALEEKIIQEFTTIKEKIKIINQYHDQLRSLEEPIRQRIDIFVEKKTTRN